MNEALDYHDFPADAETLSSISDTSAVDVQKIPLDTSRRSMKPQPSQKPGPEMMMAAALKNKEAILIRDAWKFNHPVTVVSREKFSAMIERNQVTFHG